nr:MAG TPA: hypothetical protein [Caudoviricetes sp.]
MSINFLTWGKKLQEPVNQIGLSRYVVMVKQHRERPLNP